MARTTVVVSDIDGRKIEDGKGAKLRLTYDDARRGTIEWDVSGEEDVLQSLVEKGRKVARRGRRPQGA